MFEILRKKSQVENLIATDGIEHASDRFAEIISKKLPNKKIAYQFILEELEGASMGNSASKKFAASSGIHREEYQNALKNSMPEVDGADGPQQLLHGLCLQLIKNQELMAEFRCKIGDKVMRNFGLGKYAQKQDRIDNLLASLKDILISDKDVLPALTPNISVPTNAKARHVDFREKNITSARELISILSEMTGDSSETIINSALYAVKGEEKNLSAIKLTDLVIKKSNTALGGFVDLDSDLALMIEGRSNLEPTIVMPYFYARRCASAGMYSQGAIDKQTFDKVENLFFTFMAHVGSKLTRNEQIEFQEDSLERALELEANYLLGINRNNSSLLILAAKQGISVRDALINVLDQDQDDLEQIVEPAMCAEWVMNSEFCMGFFAGGWWEPNDDFDTTSRKVLKYFSSIGIPFEAQMEKPADISNELRFRTFQQATEWAKQHPDRTVTRSADGSCYVPKKHSDYI